MSDFVYRQNFHLVLQFCSRLEWEFHRLQLLTILNNEVSANPKVRPTATIGTSHGIPFIFET